MAAFTSSDLIQEGLAKLKFYRSDLDSCPFIKNKLDEIELLFKEELEKYSDEMRGEENLKILPELIKKWKINSRSPDKNNYQGAEELKSVSAIEIVDKVVATLDLGISVDQIKPVFEARLVSKSFIKDILDYLQTEGLTANAQTGVKEIQEYLSSKLKKLEEARKERDVFLNKNTKLLRKEMEKFKIN